MSEFKAQILGLIIVIGLFALVNVTANNIFDDTLFQMETLNSTKISAAIEYNSY